MKVRRFAIRTSVASLALSFGFFGQVLSQPISPDEFIPVHSLEQITPPLDRDMLGRSDQRDLNYLNIREFLDDVVWQYQEDLDKNVYDSLSNFAFALGLYDVQLREDPSVRLSVDWETTFSRKVFLNGPKTALEDKPYNYLALSGLKSRLRTGGFWDLGAGANGGLVGSVGFNLHYLRKTGLLKLREIQKLKPKVVRGEFDADVAEDFDSVYSLEEQKAMLSEDSRNGLQKRSDELEAYGNSVFKFFEKGLRGITEPFIESDQGRAYTETMLDPLRIPSWYLDFNGQVLPISWRKVLRMQKDEMLFFTFYRDFGASLGASAGISRAGVTMPMRWAYGAAVRREQGNWVTLRVKSGLSQSLEIPRIESKLRFHLPFVSINYDLFQYIHSTGKVNIVEHVYRFNLEDPVAQAAFDDMLRLDPRKSVEAVRRKEPSVSPLIGWKSSISRPKRSRFKLAFPELAKYEKRKDAVVRHSCTYLERPKKNGSVFGQWAKECEPVPEGSDNQKLSDVLDGQTTISTTRKWNLFKLKEDDERRVLAQIATNLDPEGGVTASNRFQAQKGPAQQANVELNLRYLWKDKYTSASEFRHMTRFLQNIVSSVPELRDNQELRRFVDREIPRNSSQSFEFEFSFSHAALMRILSRSRDEVWNVLGSKELGLENIWASPQQRRDWVRKVEWDGNGEDLLCDSGGVMFPLNAYPECMGIYFHAKSLADDYYAIKQADSPLRKLKVFNNMALKINDNPALGFLLLKLNDGLEDVNYRLSLAGAGLEQEAEIYNAKAWQLLPMGYDKPVPDREDIKDTLRTVRYAELFRRKDPADPGRVVLALETSRMIMPEDKLYFDLNDQKMFYRDELKARYLVSGPLVPLQLDYDPDSNPADMTVRRYRYEIELPEGFMQRFSTDKESGKEKHTIQYMFINNNLNLALSEVGSVSFRP